MTTLKVSHDAWITKKFLTVVVFAEMTSVPVTKITLYSNLDAEQLFVLENLTPEEVLEVRKLPHPSFLIYEE
ncbi:hypothetical protein A3I99_03515 [Candidatus Kaiserbacteria bacterium RIFCSPLOWO2_02_FULL_45_11b]|uniref:Uncharacterized protein n=1 Tax=Candidatus Kaiserbacteria bacterium RIFCSPLOWO2_12_FULL_45_26 TaxID=1798525 RepID=A0A1F6FH17_9BACT|nr:MAG: hypothetical protein A2Z56_03235 [Candidatus Kaiserbacteria bacterium RIFCSPHIGHO2_12_45_16]OGG69994.1 MAG: hypothetical protein A2929_02390 [Candidatus Kaiserbacteria bacterium RIFCSPLOWO2_01_FULL_45_25]OGG83663.1 MAG: hypothetical protein A3I99_03515 [Candidatus Kaiserbacteria bacterium RIFCSPLOWO2_02_FULL_45_11b]OGG85154.1 MAG: hypothetical protein A3G90_03800 [Candidatus Kaiserbacteria bacterium RIFCSPLOWO2_12_FULL_45_26]